MTRRVVQLAAAGYLLVVLYAGLLPLRFDRTESAEAELRAAMHRWPNGPAARINRHDLWVNVLAFAPTGVLIAAGWMRSRRWTVCAAGLLAGTGVSIAIEAGQLFLPHRVCSLSDVTIDAGAALAGAAVGSLLFGPRMRRQADRLAIRLRGRHAELAAAALLMALLAGVLWAGLPSPARASEQWAAAHWSITEGLAQRPWHAWLLRCAAIYAALTLLLAQRPVQGSADASRVPCTRFLRSRRWLAALAVIGVATGVQALRLLTPGGPPNLAELAVAAVAAVAAALLIGPAREAANSLHRPVELPAVVLAAALGLAVVLAYVTWLSGSRPSDAALPFWETFWYGDHGWGLYSTMRRMAFSAGVSFMLAFYVSLRCRWALMRRMQLALAMTLGALGGTELLRAFLRPGSFSAARLGEHALAAAAGVAFFAVAWRILDRRGVSRSQLPAYSGPERRRRSE